MINFGIVGIGGFAGTWVRSLKRVESEGIARLAAAVVRNPSKYAEQVATLQAEGRTIYATYEEMLADGHGKYDVIGVPTGPAFHERMAVQAMEAGYNVLIEKPVAGTVQEVEAIAEAERRTGRWCAVGFQQIYTPSIQWLRQRLYSGRLGRLLEARSIVSWPRAANYYARNPWAGQLRYDDRWILDGPATNATAHYISHMTYLAQAVEGMSFGIESVRAELYRSKPIPSYDTSSIEIITRGGARLYETVTHATTEALEPQSVFICENGTVDWAITNDQTVIRYNDGTVETFDNGDKSYVHTYPFAQIARVAAGRDGVPLCGIYEAAPHVLIIDLAFESAMGIADIPGDVIYKSGEGMQEIYAVRGLEDALRRAKAEGGTLSDLGVAWARATDPVRAEGYDCFPSPALAKVLGA